MRVRYTAEAIADVEDILLYIAERNAAAAEIVSMAIEQVADRIGSFPYSTQATDEQGIHMVPVGRFPYLLFYMIDHNEVWIVRLRHAARLRP